jgi:hypothetical protein
MPARPKRPRISRYGFLQPRADEERGENRRVRHQTHQALACVRDEEDAYELDPLPRPRHSTHSQHVETSDIERSAPGREWKARHWRQQMWHKSRRSAWKREQQRIATRFWNKGQEPAL